MGDIYCLFYEFGFRLLHERAYLCFITSNKWMRAGYGEPLRKYFAEKTNPIILIDFSGQFLFENVTVDNNILLSQKLDNKKVCKVFQIDEDFNNTQNLEIYLNKNLTPNDNFGSAAPWVITSSVEDRIRKKIEARGTPLAEWDINIYYGIKTGFDKAFIVDNETKERLIKEDSKSAEILKPVLRGRDIKRYRVDFADLWLIFVPWHFPLHQDQTIQGVSRKAELEFQRRYPAIYKHLSNHRKRLEKRNKAETGIRYEWFALQRCAASYSQEFEKEKIVWAELARTGNSFIIDKQNHFSMAGTFILTLNKRDLNAFDFRYLVSMFNHPTTLIYLEYVYSKLDVTGWQWKKAPFEKIPIPRASFSEQQVIISLYDEFMHSPEKEKLERLSWLDKKIFDFLGFNDEEIKHTFKKLMVFSEEENFFYKNILS